MTVRAEPDEPRKDKRTLSGSYIFLAVFGAILVLIVSLGFVDWDAEGWAVRVSMMAVYVLGVTALTMRIFARRARDQLKEKPDDDKKTP